MSFFPPAPYRLWFLLSIPAALMIAGVIFAGGRLPEDSEILHISGELSAWTLIAAMLASPLSLVLRGWRGPRWMVKNRRYFGVAAFGYAALHTWFYLLDRGTFDAVAGEALQFDIWTGWIAFLIFVPLAATSMDFAVRKLGRRWKALQRATYVAAVLTALHWASLHDWGGVGPALVFFGPLAVLQVYRLWFWYLRPRERAAAGRVPSPESFSPAQPNEGARP